MFGASGLCDTAIVLVFHIIYYMLPGCGASTTQLLHTKSLENIVVTGSVSLSRRSPVRLAFFSLPVRGLCQGGV